MHYQWSEIIKHNTEESCWLVAHNKVYDVTKFLKIHPPERDVIMRHITNNSQEVSESYDFHRSNTQKLWKKYLIGDVSDKKICIIQ
jgi:cytochrome b involved in lipid metabolism